MGPLHRSRTPRLAPLLALSLALGACRSSGGATPPPPALPAAPCDGVHVAGALYPGTPAHACVTVPAEGTVRVRLSTTDAFSTLPSWAVDPAALAAPPPAFTVEETDAAVTVRTARLGLRITRAPLRAALLDPAGQVITAEADPVWIGAQGGADAWTLSPTAHVYGLGDKAGPLNRRGRAYTSWNTDAYGWGPGADPLYKSIPFAVVLDEGRSYGLFFDNPTRSTLGVGAPGATNRLLWSGERGGLDLYLFAGPDPKDVVAGYAALTGRTPLPPRWTLGYHQSRYSYMSEAEVRTLAADLRSHGFPADAIWLDIDFQEGNAPFTVSATRFPTFGAMVSDLKAQQGIRTVVITDLHLKAARGYAPYDQGLAGDHLVHAADGSVFVGNVWPGASVFPEFTRAADRAWWGTLYAGFVGQGVDGFWNDMNEPALFDTPERTIPDDVRHRLDGGGALDHVAVHNAYGSLNARATCEGVLALRPSVRPFVLTRAAYAGTQRWAATWTGDNVATRAHLALTVPQLGSLGVSGYPFAGADVGGFVGCPGADLLTEWMELGAWQPFYRNHSTRDACRREPWVDGADHEARRRAAVEGRYRLLPYLYTAFEDASRTGLPVMRPLWLDRPANPSTWTNDRAFLLGEDLLVSARLDAGTTSWSVTLPAGRWWDTRTGAPAEGGVRRVTPAAAESLRVFARAGAIVPQAPVTLTADAAPQGPLTLDVWPGDDCRGRLYLDDGESFAYREGALRRVAYTCAARPGGITVQASSTGTYATWWSGTALVIHGVPSAPTEVTAAGVEAPGWSYDAAAQALTIQLPGGGADWTVTAAWTAAARRR
ncbi:MAG: glycoside hydrolase family 31 protein [Anaeromyxobacter sp.]